MLGIRTVKGSHPFGVYLKGLQRRTKNGDGEENERVPPCPISPGKKTTFSNDQSSGSISSAFPARMGNKRLSTRGRAMCDEELKKCFNNC